MKSRFEPFVMLAGAVSVLIGCAASTPAPPARLAVGVQSAKPDETRTAWAPLVADIGAKLGRPSSLLAASQREIVEALRDRRVDVVWLSSSAAIDAVTEAGAEAIALYVNVNGARGYKGVLLARTDSGIRTLDEALAPGKYRYASGAKTSTSGYLLPQHFLFNPRKSTPESTFRSVIYGSHFDNLQALWDRRIDVAVNNSTDTAVFQARTPQAQSGLVVLWESPLVPNDVLMVRRDMAEPAKRALREFFVERYGKTDSEREMYRRASGIREFVATTNRLLEPVAAFKFANERTAIESNAALSAADKAAQLKLLEARSTAFKQALGS